jgi:uncharacterized protein (DUF2164 family)
LPYRFSGSIAQETETHYLNFKPKYDAFSRKSQVFFVFFPKEDLLMTLQLSKERRKQLTSAIKTYFLEQDDEDLGDLRAGLLLDFFLEKLGPTVYNQAIKDAQRYFQQKVDDLDGACYALQEDLKP